MKMAKIETSNAVDSNATKNDEKKAKMNKATEVAATKNGNGNGNGHAEEETDLPVLTKAQKMELFTAYKKAEDALTAHTKQHETLVKNRSDAIRAIADKTGSSGPFLFGGRHLTISSRGDTYFFKGPKSVEVEKID